jgi:hypothetical protein
MRRSALFVPGWWAILSPLRRPGKSRKQNFFIENPEKVIAALCEREPHLLDAVNCTVIPPNEKPFKAIAAYGASGLYTVVSDAKSRLTVSHFISVLDVTKIATEDRVTFSINFSTVGGLKFESDRFVSVVESLLSIREVLLYNCPSVRPIELIGMTPKSSSFRVRPLALSNTRYSVICGKLEITPSPWGRAFFADFDLSTGTALTFDDHCERPRSPRIIPFVLSPEPQLTVVTFRSFCPYTVCKILRGLLKHSRVLSTVVLEGYQDLTFEQFDFPTLNEPSVVSWHFKRLFSEKPERAYEFFRLFRQYRGMIQQISISQVPFNQQTSAEFAQCLHSTPCYRLVELVSLDKLEVSDKEFEFAMMCMTSIAAQLPPLFRLHLGGRQPLISPHPSVWKSLGRCSLLRSCSLSCLDLTTMTTGYQMPSVVAIEFSSCKFSAVSLLNVFKAKHDDTRGLMFTLKDIEMNESEWSSFAAQLEQLEPMTNIVEIDW